LPAGSDRHGVAHLHAPGTQLHDHRVEVVDCQREMLSHVGRRLPLDEVDLLAADVEPGAAKAEIGPVGALGQPEHVHVEASRDLGIGHVDRNVVDRSGLHAQSLARMLPP
jgi:hypothetical protein